MLRLSEKKELVEDLHRCFQKAAILILTDNKGLNVESVNELRRKLRDAGVEYRVVKNTLLWRAAEGTDVAVVTDDFIGPTAIAIGYDDPVEPAKVLAEFAKANEKLEIKAGVMNGDRLAVDNIVALSKLPSREVLLSQFLSVLNGVPTSFVRVLNGVPQKLVYALNAIRDQKDAA